MMAINMFYEEVKTFLEALKMGGNALGGGHQNGNLFFPLKRKLS